MIYYKLRHNLIIPYQFNSNSGKVDRYLINVEQTNHFVENICFMLNYQLQDLCVLELGITISNIL